MKKVILFITFILTPVNMVYAGCPELAKTFSTDPNKMNVNELASLKKCVTSKLREKFSYSSPATPASAPIWGEAPAPMPAPPIMPVPSR